MGVTSHLTQDVAPMPFLWVLPLCVYLLSFILCFEGRGWYRRAWYLPAFIAWFAVMNYDLLERIASHGLAMPVALYCIGLFIACMACHGELARLKPHPDHLTLFYLMIAFGGALGGEGVDAEALGLQLPAAVGLEEVEAGRGAGDCQHAGWFQHLDRLGNAADTTGDDAAAVGEAEHGDR